MSNLDELLRMAEQTEKHSRVGRRQKKKDPAIAPVEKYDAPQDLGVPAPSSKPALHPSRATVEGGRPNRFVAPASAVEVAPSRDPRGRPRPRDLPRCVAYRDGRELGEP
ncbi:MAG: hypothetical protein ACE5EF_00120 [Dehalococcoidia bacterium]